MKSRSLFLVVGLALVLSSVASAKETLPRAIDNLQPQPKKVVVAAGVCANPSSIQVVRGEVEGVRADLAGEAYELTVQPDGVKIKASDARGERYARTTLAQLVKLSGGKVACCTITDWPQYRWRGLMHDCGRNFLDLGTIRKVLDLMAAYKYNLFHWHLTDYYGWRLESKKYPMLQAPWAFRRQMSRYYTQEDFRAIVDYAAARGITVMPEFDVPGHSLAFRRGLDIEHMAERKVRGIVCDLIDELCSLATPEEMPFIHLGTDEARTPWEQVPDAFCPAWAEQVIKNGRRPVGWTPGKPMTTAAGEKSVKMMWHAELAPAADEFAFDSTRLYFGGTDGMNLLNIAAFSKPFRYDIPAAQKLGPIMCSWHDDMLGEDTAILLRNNHFGPATVMYSSLMWESRDRDFPEYLYKLPKPGTDDFGRVRRFEERIVAQRDKVLAGLDMPFAFVKQTDLRWRVSDEQGSVVGTDVAQGTVYIRKWVRQEEPNTTNAFILAKTGTATLETWIRSGSRREIGAWIGFTHYGRSGGRTRGLPELGEWDSTSKGIRVTVNGRLVPPPVWGRPGLKYIMAHPEEPTSNNISELPFTNEEYWMREPSRIQLEAGWNHVKIVVPHSKDRYNYNWVATFVPVAGTSDHPHEVEGLEYSSEPK